MNTGPTDPAWAMTIEQAVHLRFAIALVPRLRGDTSADEVAALLALAHECADAWLQVHCPAGPAANGRAEPPPF